MTDKVRRTSLYLAVENVGKIFDNDQVPFSNEVLVN